MTLTVRYYGMQRATRGPITRVSARGRCRQAPIANRNLGLSTFKAGIGLPVEPPVIRVQLVFFRIPLALEFLRT